MSIPESPSKIKSVVVTTMAKVEKVYVLLLLVVVASIFFALGRLSMVEEKHSPLKVYSSQSAPKQSTDRSGILQTSAAIEAVQQITGSTTNIQSTNQGVNQNVNTALPADTQNDGEVIGSKSGKKYYFPWCGTIKRVKPENQVHFASINLARAAGYTPAKNCKGLK